MPTVSEGNTWLKPHLEPGFIWFDSWPTDSIGNKESCQSDWIQYIILQGKNKIDNQQCILKRNGSDSAECWEWWIGNPQKTFLPTLAHFYS